MVKAVELVLPLGVTATGVVSAVKANQQITNQSTTTDLLSMPSYESINVNSVCNSNLSIIKNLQKVTLKSETLGIKECLSNLKGEQIPSTIDRILDQIGVDDTENNEKIAILDDGTCIIKGLDNGCYVVFVSENNSFGFDSALTYTPWGDIVKARKVFKNLDGSFTEKEITCRNDEIFSVKETTKTNGYQTKVVEETFGYLSKKTVEETPLPDEYKKMVKVPSGHIIDKTTGKLIKVNPQKIQIENNNSSKGYCNGIRVSDEFGNKLGEVNYDIGYGKIYFYGLQSYADGLGIGTKIINELKKMAEEKGYTLRAQAGFDSLMGCGVTKPASNLEFYYKMGFRAINPGIDKIVRDCIERGINIPTYIERKVPIQYDGKTDL